MVPGAIVCLEALPLTPNGKVDRRGLPAPDPNDADGDRAAPRDSLERQLVEIWEELLGRSPVGIRDDFFALGGHSLLAVRMMSRVEQAVGRRVPLGTLFTGATVERLAESLRREWEDPGTPILLNPAGTRPPFLYLHGEYTGPGLYCLRLAQKLGPDQPLLVLPSAPVDPARWQSIEEVAAEQLRAVRTARPHGPYLLGGYCNGGLVALEMARILLREGERVEMVILVSTPGENAYYRRLASWVEGCGRALGLTSGQRRSCFVRLRRWTLPAGRLLREYRGVPRGKRLAFVRGRARRALEIAAGALSAPRPGDGADRAGPEARPDRTLDVLREMVASYVPSPYPGPVTVLWAAEGSSGGMGPMVGWDRVASEVDFHVVPGAHHDCITTHLDALADRMADCLRRPPAGSGSR